MGKVQALRNGHSRTVLPGSLGVAVELHVTMCLVLLQNHVCRLCLGQVPQCQYDGQLLRAARFHVLCVPPELEVYTNRYSS